MSLTISRTIAVKQKLGRNDPCYCGSGKKYKKCHLNQDETYAPEKKQGTISTIVDYLTSQQFFQDMVSKAFDEIQISEDKLDEHVATAIIEANIFAGKYQKQTPFDYFISHASLSATEIKLYEHWKQLTRFSLFEVLSVNIGKSMEVKDIVNGQLYHVLERFGTYQIEPGIIVGARIVPVESSAFWMFTGGTMASFSKEAAYAIKRLFSSTKIQNIDQLEFVKTYYGNKAKNTQTYTYLTYDKARILLLREIKKRHIPLSIQTIDSFAKNPKKFKFNEITKLFAKACASKDEFEDLINLFLYVINSYPDKNEKEKMGSKEKLLIQTLMSEAQETLINKQKNFEFLSQKEKQKRIDTFSEKWFKTPQDELGGKTPKEVIEEERKMHGVTKEFKYTLNVSPVKTAGDVFFDIYDKGITLMSNGQYLEALENFSQVIPSLTHIPELFRFWANVGSCIANLGDEKQAKKYYQKALSINPNYDVAKNNLATFNDSKKVQQLHFGGKQRLFETVLERGIMLDNKLLKDNELLHDASVFLYYIGKHSPQVTLIKKDIVRKDLLAISHQFIHPDPEQLVVRNKQKIVIDQTYKDEWQFPKVNFLHMLLLAGKLMKQEKQKLHITKQGENFLNVSPSQQFSEIFRIWFTTLHWAELDRRTGWVSKFPMEKDMSELFQSISYQLLTELYNHADQKINPIHLLEAVTQQDDELGLTMFSIFMERIVLQYLLWAGIIISSEALGPIRIQNPITFLQQPEFKITSFGKYLVESIEQSMENAIPKVLRTIV